MPIPRIEMSHATFESTLVFHPSVYTRTWMYKRIRVLKLVLPLNLVTIFGKFFNTNTYRFSNQACICCVLNLAYVGVSREGYR